MNRGRAAAATCSSCSNRSHDGVGGCWHGCDRRGGSGDSDSGGCRRRHSRCGRHATITITLWRGCRRSRQRRLRSWGGRRRHRRQHRRKERRRRRGGGVICALCTLCAARRAAGRRRDARRLQGGGDVRQRLALLQLLGQLLRVRQQASRRRELRVRRRGWRRRRRQDAAGSVQGRQRRLDAVPAVAVVQRRDGGTGGQAFQRRRR